MDLLDVTAPQAKQSAEILGSFRQSLLTDAHQGDCLENFTFHCAFSGRSFGSSTESQLEVKIYLSWHARHGADKASCYISTSAQGASPKIGHQTFACVMGGNVYSKEIRCYLPRTIQTQLTSGFIAPSQTIFKFIYWPHLLRPL